MTGRILGEVKTQLALCALSVTLSAALSLGAASAAHADRPEIDEGGDTQPCVVEREFDLIENDAPAGMVSRVFDTDGRRVGKRALARVIAYEFPELAGAVTTAPPQFRQVRRYETCLTGFVLVEFNKHTKRVVCSYFQVSYDPNAIRMVTN